ncbi:MAG TPA: glycosyl hydrolase family 18 protein, partial [Ferruginibacter sp.]|nr:glycosyl hydrolase family 18 protein [Ferruginibacter sp.]
MSNTAQVFQTNSATRWKSIKWTSRIILLVILFLLAVLVLAVINGRNPNLPNISSKAKYYQAKLDPANKLTFTSPLNRKFKGFKDFLEKQQQEDSLKKVQRTKLHAPQIRAAFYTPWLSTSLPDLKRNGDKLNTIFPEWFFIDPVTHKLQTRIDSAGLAVMKQKSLSIQPIFTNFYSNKNGNGTGDFDGDLAHVIINDPVKRKGIITQIADTLIYYQLQGLNIDLEELKERSNETLTRFQKELYEALHSKGLLVSMDVSPKNEDYDYKALADYNDHLILMAYDQYNDASGAGPISAQKWIEEQLDWLDNQVDASKIILGVAGYGRDWYTDEDGKHVTDLTYTEVIDKAKLADAKPIFDNDSYNLRFNYLETETDTSAETKHSIWFTDAATIFNILRYSDDYETAGTALWHLGGEDPRTWNFYGRSLSTASLRKDSFDFNSLSHLPADPNRKPTAKGGGELLDIVFTPGQGTIKLETDKNE